MSESKLLLIDGHSMAFRAFYGLPFENFQTSTGQYTNAVYGFTSMLVTLLNEEQPTHVGVAFDVSRVSFRTAEYPDYKGTRSAAPPEFQGQVELIKQLLDAVNIVHIEAEDFEADDILATLTTQAVADGMTVEISSGDRDIIQLVTDDVTLLYPKRGVTEMDRMTPQAVQAKYAVPPQRYPELAALVGETSDNLPGVPGVGPKTAAKWINEYDGLDNLLARAEQVKGKVGESLREHLDDVKRNRKLNALVRTVSLPVGPGDLGRVDMDVAALNGLFDSLEFRSALRERVFGTLLSGDQQKTVTTLEIKPQTLKPGALGAWLAAQELVAIDPVGQWGHGTGDVSGLGLSGTDGKTVYVDLTTLNPADDKALADWLADENRHKIMHSAKEPLLAFWNRGLDLAGLQSDTELAAYLLHPDERGYALPDLVLQYLGADLNATQDEEDTGNQGMLDFGTEPDTAAEDSQLRAHATFELSQVLDEQLSKVGQTNLLAELELPLSRVLARMEATGIAVDTQTMTALRDSYDSRVVKAQDAAFSVIGHQINLGSPKQLQTVLFDELKMPKTRKKKSGYTTDAAALESLYAQTEHPFLQHLLEHRDAIKLRQIVDSLLSSIAADGRIHTTFQQTVAATGRLSSADPNLQNIPTRTDEGRQVRECFVNGPDYEALLSVDYSQIEMRVMADASGDERLIEAFRSGVDFHTVTAGHVFGVEPDSVTPEQRAHVKQMNYGLAYGLSAFGLSSRLGISVGEARTLMEEYFKTFGKVRDYLQGIVSQARRTGYTETMLGRRRYLPDLNSTNYQRREMAERAALNAPIQGTAADIIKVAMLKLDAAMAQQKCQSRVLLQVHDELIIEVAPGEHEAIEALVKDVMAHAVDLKVPLDVSVGYGHTWAAAAH